MEIGASSVGAFSFGFSISLAVGFVWIEDIVLQQKLFGNSGLR
jgi:hypothetical protein